MGEQLLPVEVGFTPEHVQIAQALIKRVTAHLKQPSTKTNYSIGQCQWSKSVEECLRIMVSETVTIDLKVTTKNG